jgi:nucleoside-diphosphate-sugar epimerase
MRVFVAGATGTLGRPTVRALVAAGHTVRGVARRPENVAVLRALGAEPALVADFFDAAEMERAVAGSEAVLHLATHIPPIRRMRQRRAWRDNDRLRSQGSSILVNAALAAGTRVYVQESVTFLYQDLGDTWLYETAPIDAAWPLASVRDAERETARFGVRGGQGIVLRLGLFYGPDAPSTRDVAKLARWRLVPIVGDGSQYVSSIHVEDAAAAVAASLGVQGGIYNVVDDEPLVQRDYLGTMAAAFGFKPPRSISRRLATLLLGPGTDALSRSQRVSNTMFKAVAPWTPKYPSVRQGWPAVAAVVRT